MGPCLDWDLAHSQLIVEEQVVVEHLQPQLVILLCQEVVKLLLPPGVSGVSFHLRLAKVLLVAEHLDVAISSAQEFVRQVFGTQVEYSDMGLYQCQGAQEAQE